MTGDEISRTFVPNSVLQAITVPAKHAVLGDSVGENREKSVSGVVGDAAHSVVAFGAERNLVDGFEVMGGESRLQSADEYSVGKVGLRHRMRIGDTLAAGCRRRREPGRKYGMIWVALPQVYTFTEELHI